MALMLLGVMAFGCGADDSSPATSSVSRPSEPSSVSEPTEPVVALDIGLFVLPETDDLALLDSQAALSERPNDGPTFSTFAFAGSPDDNDDGPRVGFGIADATGVPVDDVTSEGDEIAIASRSFHRTSEGENQRTYVGPTPEGTTVAMATLNVDEAAAVRLLTDAEMTVDGGVVFGDRAVPDGWVDIGTSTTQLQFIAGATGSSTPIGGTRDLYGDPASAVTPSWDDINSGFGVTLSTWPVTGTDPESEARYNLAGEADIEIRRADGSITIGFASPSDSEFIEFVVWQDGTSWLALSRPAGNQVNALADLAATVRQADRAEIEQLTLLREE